MFVTTDTYKMENRKSKLNALLTKFKTGKPYYLGLLKKKSLVTLKIHIISNTGINQ